MEKEQDIEVNSFEYWDEHEMRELVNYRKGCGALIFLLLVMIALGVIFYNIFF